VVRLQVAREDIEEINSEYRRLSAAAEELVHGDD
jgi:hypothetical protein